MTVIATLEVPADAFTLGEALTANPGIHVRLVRVVPIGSRLIPYFWATNSSIDEIEAALQAEDDIESFETVDTVGEEALIRVEWVEHIDGFVDALRTTDATILEGTGEADVWTLRVRFDEHTQLAAFYRQCAAEDIPVDLLEVHNPGLPAETGLGLGLTDVQQETLLAALEKGYFAVPRGINLTELAAELGISDTAASQRLRRGISTLITATLSQSNDES
jgi:predicted DNA binding protein